MNAQTKKLKEHCKYIILVLVVTSYTEKFKGFKKGYKIIFATFKNTTQFFSLL